MTEHDELAAALTATLEAHGVDPTPSMLSDLAEVIAERDTWWDIHRTAEFLDMAPPSVKAWLSKRGLRRTMMVRAELVRRKKAEMPGRGARPPHRSRVSA